MRSSGLPWAHASTHHLLGGTTTAMQLRSLWLPLAMIAVLGAATGIASVITPSVALLLAVFPASVALLGGTPSVATGVVLGLLALFEVEGGLTAEKLALIALFLIVVLAGLVRGAQVLPRSSAPDIGVLTSRQASTRHLVGSARSSALLANALLLPSVAASVGNAPSLEIARDALPYVMLFSSPLLVAAGWRRLSRLAATRLLLIGASIAAASWVWTWAGRRSILPTGGDPFALASLGFVIAGSGILFFGTEGGRPSVLRVTAGLGLSSIGVITGTRSQLVLLLVPFAAVAASRFGADGEVTLPARRVLAAVTVLAALGAATVSFQPFGYNSDALERRIQATLRIAQAIETDQSFRTRLDGAESALEQFMDAPLVGQGFGKRIQAERSFAEEAYESFSADTSLSVLAKAGLLGVVAIVVSLRWWLLAARRFAYPSGRRTIQIALLVAGLSLPFRAVLIDKGFGVSLALIVLATASQTGDQDEAAQASQSVSSASKMTS